MDIKNGVKAIKDSDITHRLGLLYDFAATVGVLWVPVVIGLVAVLEGKVSGYSEWSDLQSFLFLSAIALAMPVGAGFLRWIIVGSIAKYPRALAACCVASIVTITCFIAVAEKPMSEYAVELHDCEIVISATSMANATKKVEEMDKAGELLFDCDDQGD